ncbi:DUF3310 domain-containing protein [Streptomyces sp. IBSBF 2950]|uniref:DUF3310 domain-containing protein n=1 Tax=Streptomyces sp. IBSBF 2950 TaxID=2903528 RepID=UPI002FDC0128
MTDLRFKVGDRVVVAAPRSGDTPASLAAGIYANHVGTVTSLYADAAMPYPYEVTFDGGGSLCFTDQELIHESEFLLAKADLSFAQEVASRENDVVNHPAHYTWLPGGLEVIDITKNFGFVRGNALKYLFRADFKGRTVEDLKKARWYIDYEIKQLEAEESK